MSTLCVFDFDGTITRKDSYLLFIFYSVSLVKKIIGFTVFSPVYFFVLVKIISMHRFKEWVTGFFFKGMKDKDIIKYGDRFCDNVISKICYKQALDKIEWHKSNGHEVIIVSASLDVWIKPWCDANKLKYVSTTLQFQDGIVTGKFVGKNCNGAEKVRKLREIFDLSEYEEIYVYGNSSGDKHLLKLATHPFYKVFNR